MIKKLATLFCLLIAEVVLAGEAVSLKTPTGILCGTLEAPSGTKPFPVALIIAGSGPTDRDGNSKMLPGSNNNLKLLAESLAEQGIASLRYDKRGIAESAPAGTKEEDLRFETYIDDAVAWGQFLHADQRFGVFAIVGHSEGSLIGIVAAQKLNVNGVVSIAGVGQPASETILQQVKPQLPPDLLKQTEDIVKELLAGKTVATIPPVLQALFRPSVQPYLISWFKYDPSKEVAKVTAPILVVQGTTDIQVGIEDAQCLAKANSNAKLLLVDGMNHVFKEVPSDLAKQIASYSDPSLPLAPKLIDGVAEFIKGLKAKSPGK